MLRAMILRAGACAFLALLLAWPVPLVLAKARWPSVHPRSAIVLWQAVGLAGGLALLTAELTLTAAGRPGSWPAAVRGLFSARRSLGAIGWIGLVAFVATVFWLIGVLVRSTVRVVSARRRHRYLLDLLGADRRIHSAKVPADVYLLAHPVPAAYSVPGLRPRIVVSAGAATAFDQCELDAVIDHERAHLRQHHDIVVQPFIAWERSFPFLPAAARALHSVELLTENLADDAAQQRHGRPALLGALQLTAEQGHDVRTRCDRLRSQPAQSRPRGFVAPACALGAAALLLLPPVLLWLS